MRNVSMPGSHEVLSTRELRNQSGVVLKRVADERAHFAITSHGKPVAALVPVDELADETPWTGRTQVRALLAGVEPDPELATELRELREQSSDDLGV
jgi:prevent-host-death family protein